MKRACFSIILAAFSALALADNRLPHQPVAADGGYIVKWDCAQNTWASSNDMEYDETFFFAVNLGGTALGDWLMQTPASGKVRSVAFDKWRDKEGSQYDDHTARLWHIRDTIYGAIFNFRQLDNFMPGLNSRTKIAARFFGFETPMGTKCDIKKPSSGSNWYIWPSGWPEAYTTQNDDYLFRFAAYSGTKTGASFSTLSADDPRDIYCDNGTYVSRNGYASPGSTMSPCPQAWPVDQTVTHDVDSLCPGEEVHLGIAASQAGWTYSLYKDGTEVSGSAKSGGSTLLWTISASGAYSVYATADNGQHDDWMGDCDGTRSTIIKAKTQCENCEALIFRKWDDFLFVDNSSNRFTAFQWYRNGELLEGETKQYIRITSASDTYHCLCQEQDGTPLETCARTFGACLPSAAQYPASKGAPRLVLQGKSLSIEGADDTAQADVYNAQGVCLLHISGNQAQLDLPCGCYILRITDQNRETYIEKIILH